MYEHARLEPLVRGLLTSIFYFYFLAFIHSFITLPAGCYANVWVFSVFNSRVKHLISEFVLKEASAMATRAPVRVQGVAILHTKAEDHLATPLRSGRSDLPNRDF